MIYFPDYESLFIFRPWLKYTWANMQGGFQIFLSSAIFDDSHLKGLFKNYL